MARARLGAVPRAINQPGGLPRRHTSSPPPPFDGPTARWHRPIKTRRGQPKRLPDVPPCAPQPARRRAHQMRPHPSYARELFATPLQNAIAAADFCAAVVRPLPTGAATAMAPSCAGATSPTPRGRHLATRFLPSPASRPARSIKSYPLPHIDASSHELDSFVSALDRRMSFRPSVEAAATNVSSASDFRSATGPAVACALPRRTCGNHQPRRRVKNK
jgi:hypothetical protein